MSDKKLPPLNKEQVNYALQLIEDAHPMKSASITQIFPALEDLRDNWGFKCIPRQKKNFRFSMKKALRKKMGMEIPPTDLDIDKDPFLRLGFGMNSYYKLLRQLSVLFFMLSIFTMPLMIMYSSYQGLEDQPKYFANKFSIGNLGKWQSLLNQLFRRLRCRLWLGASRCRGRDPETWMQHGHH